MAGDKVKAAANGSNRSAGRAAASRSAAAKTDATPQSINGHELTSVDKKWGVLFDANGQPTHRFVDVMSSLARYIIDAFPTAESIVLVPAKMAAFYNFHAVDKDPFKYQLIFHPQAKGGHHRSLAELYQDLGCAYHLVQASPAAPPRIPGLTREGFARWMALQLQAFPDEVAARLERVVSDFALETASAIDGKSERLPKQLSRYLLPAEPDYQIRALLQQAVKRHFGEAALSSSSSASAAAPAVPRPPPAISYSDGEHDPPRQRPDAVISGHRRYSSYSGPAAPLPRPPLHDEDDIGRSHSRPRQARRSTELSHRRRPSDEYEYDDYHRRRHHDHHHHRHRHHRHPSPDAHKDERLHGGRDTARRSRNLPQTLLDALLHPGRSPDRRANHRGPSPQPRSSHRASLPAVHNAGRGTVNAEDSDDNSTRHRPVLRDVCYKAIERRDRDDKSYRLYGSSLPLPLSTSPVLQYASASHARDESMPRSAGGRASRAAAAKPADRRPQPRRSAAALHSGEDGNGSDGDQTWDEYLRVGEM